MWPIFGEDKIDLHYANPRVALAIIDVLFITETNVPHQENISYFGDYLPGTGKTDEAQLVYNFTLTHQIALPADRWQGMLRDEVSDQTSLPGYGVRWLLRKQTSETAISRADTVG